MAMGASDGGRGQPKGSASEPLRREAERRWAEADEAAAEGKRRTQKRAKARASRQDVLRKKDEEIARLKGELARGKRRE